MKLKIGDLAPLFKMEDSDGQLIDSSDLKGSKVVLYFYPKDDTPGCTAQACNLNENLSYLQANGFVVIGVSADSNKAHEKFKLKYNLNFSLLSDPNHDLLNAYGVWVEKSMYGKSYMGIARTTFIIDEKGYIFNIIEKVDTKNHTTQIH
ncbi:MAG: thioredoxin-dependent thiol peroxidase [Cytophagales bacterium]|nr:thioredoxin-dependent thiol peroxidase [Cytophagales bacterium]